MSGSDQPRLGFGETIYDEDGQRLGRIRGFDEHGFYVTTDEGIKGMSVEHLRSGHELGEAELMWRCWECGEMDHIDDDLPDECPNCGAAREDLYYYQED
jgi:rubrerythrin